MISLFAFPVVVNGKFPWKNLKFTMQIIGANFRKWARSPRIGLAVGLGGLLVAAPSPAFAYIDPGTGSLLLQSIIGAVVTGLTVGRIYWEKIKSFFGKPESEFTDRGASDGAANKDGRKD